MRVHAGCEGITPRPLFCLAFPYQLLVGYALVSDLLKDRQNEGVAGEINLPDSSHHLLIQAMNHLSAILEGGGQG